MSSIDSQRFHPTIGYIQPLQSKNVGNIPAVDSILFFDFLFWLHKKGRAKVSSQTIANYFGMSERSYNNRINYIRGQYGIHCSAEITIPQGQAFVFSTFLIHAGAGWSAGDEDSYNRVHFYLPTHDEKPTATVNLHRGYTSQMDMSFSDYSAIGD